ncbi:MAG: type VI secretion system baseplate subunit TssF [Saccharospirillum sp.]
MITELYQRELHALREKATEFARKYPAYAPHLGGASSDPDVERILEGVAYLGAGIQERLDSGFPQLAQSLLNLVAPQLIEEVPATTIMGFTPKSILKEPLRVPAGTFIDTAEVRGAKCRFATSHDITVLPIAIKDISLETLGDRSGVLKVQFNMLSGYSRRLDLSELTFLAADDYLQASALFFQLKTSTRAIVIRQGGQERVLRNTHLASLGTDDHYSLLPRPTQSLPTYQRLTEYYINKYQYLSFRLASDRPQELMSDGGDFSLEFHLHNLRGKTPRLSKNSLRLFTVPAINLFPHDSEPVMIDQRDADIQLHPARNVDQRYQVHSVRSVNGHNRQTASRSVYQPLSLLSRTSDGGGVYELIRQMDTDSGACITRLSISYPDDDRIPQRETLTASLRCSNGALASELKQGDVSKGTQNTSELVEFSNLIAPTGYVPPKTGDDLWSLLSHLTINYLPMANLDNLKGLLRLYLPQQGAGKHDESANRKRLDSMQALEVTPTERLLRGSLIRGQHLTLSVDGSGFAGLGDLFLFGEVLHRLLCDFATLNAFVELTIIDTNSAEELEWKTRPGQRSSI